MVAQLKKLDASVDKTIIVSHGSWLKPAGLGYQLGKRGYRWVYVPHGMLEPWSRSSGRLKKLIYYYLFEKRYAKNASAIRAVSAQEQHNLMKLFNRPVTLIHNGVTMPEPQPKAGTPYLFLFMARLHFKKGLLPLVKGWHRVMLQANASLVIAGPDEGELDKIKPYLGHNIAYVGPIYGPEKEKLLSRAHYYVLPSFSEGFPTSVLEAMSYGAIPLISKGCNFPDVFEHKLGYNIEPDENQIAGVLDHIGKTPFNQRVSAENVKFIERNYSEEVIGEKLRSFYSSLLNTSRK